MKKLLILAAAVVTLSLTAVAATGAAADGEDGPFGNFLTRVADKLGISEEQLETAIQDARLETIDEALAEGRITEEQAAKMRERVQEGASLFPKRPHHRPGAGVIVGSAAQVLDMEKAGLVEQLKDGSSLAEVAEAQGMSVEVFTAALLSQTEAQIDEMVDEGKLTAEKAERISQTIEENIDRIVNGHHEPGRHRGHWHRGGEGSPAPSQTFTEVTL